MRKETLITILNQQQDEKQRPKGVARPSKRSQYLARRVNSPEIRLFDLAQVNHGDPKNPVWEDHPILKTPNYTVTATGGIYEGVFNGLDYEIEPFGDTDFASYTEMFFNYPVNDWAKRYRQVSGSKIIEGEGTYWEQDIRISINDETKVFPQGDVLLPNMSFQEIGDWKTTKDVLLEEHGYAWNQTKNGVLYTKPSSDIVGCYQPKKDIGNIIAAGYLPFSISALAEIKEQFKVTSIKDPNAEDVGELELSGVVDIYLMPSPGFFYGRSVSPDFQTTQLVGMCYQVNPRHKWAGYLAGNTYLNGDGDYYNNALVDDYLDYQLLREGVQASRWTYTGYNAEGHYRDFVESSISPHLFPEFDGYCFATQGDVVSGDGFQYLGSVGALGGNTADNLNRFNTAFYTNDDEIFGNLMLFKSTEPLLTAVIKLKGKFYYCWDVQHINPNMDWGGFGNVTPFELRRGEARFLLSRNIDWVVIGDLIVPPLPRDGSWTLWDF